MKVFNFLFGLYRVVLYTLIVLYVVVAVGPMAAGIRSFVVLSASMEPTIMTGSLVYIRQAETEAPLAKFFEYKTPEAGDIVAFKQGTEKDNITVVHRILEKDATGKFVTKGDNNPETDIGAVLPSQVIGQYVFSIPKLGYFTTWLQSKKGIIIAVVLGLVALISSFITDTDENVKDKKKKDDDENYENDKPDSNGSDDPDDDLININAIDLDRAREVSLNL